MSKVHRDHRQRLTAFKRRYPHVFETRELRIWDDGSQTRTSDEFAEWCARHLRGRMDSMFDLIQHSDAIECVSFVGFEDENDAFAFRLRWT